MQNYEEFLNEQKLNEAVTVKKSLVILRGVPGSGKSTFAELIAGGDTGIICCADDFFMQDGKYNWDRSKIGQAHKECQEKCKSLMEKSAPMVIISNTNVKESDFAPYIEMAEKYGYRVFSIIVENRHGGTNVHNVPDDTISSMTRKFQISL